ncbi:helix-turn-helix protein [Mucilaginibacter gracilis]|uniref:Helix-turn-helix protein n=1 Tax=Mucilaginibacter gracilis TaxID=423350 RepID=A0A495IZ83_9SPHI|nr:helix-turn-helix domain-containing protein [Mucilaginibacter gracilis]RKR82040.1 helix-turn-helix protein [Mucilaginibacter gracilis]
MTTNKPDELLTRKEAARMLKFSPETLAVWDCTKRYNLNPIKIGNSVRYRRSDLNKFLEQCKTIKRPKK